MTAQDSSSPQLTPPPVRWLPAVVIVVLANGALAVIWLAPELVRGMRTVYTMIALGLAGFSLAVWFFFTSRLSGRARLCGLAALIVGGGALVALRRLDGFDGDMVPLSSWRWSPSAEERFATSRTSRESSPAGTPVRLEQPTARDYPGFLGRDRRAVVDGIRLERDWARHPPRELWRWRVGLGWSAFAVAGDFAVTQEQRGDEETVVCYDLRTRRERWVHADKARFSEPLGGDGPRATPTIAAGRVYSLGATGILNCLDGSNGKRLWSRNILSDAGAANITWGMCGSPLLLGNAVIVSPGGKRGHSLVAYDKDSGKTLWHAGGAPAGYASPMVTELDGLRQILVFNGSGLTGHDVKTGKPLWSHEWETHQHINAAQPVPLADFGYSQGADRVLISSAYGEGACLLTVHRAGQKKFHVHELWRNSNLKAKFSNVIVHGDYAYGFDEGVLCCIDLEEGKRQWRGGRYGHGQMILVGGLLLIQAENPGDVVLVEATPEAHTEVARHPALEGRTWNHPALAGNLLLVRNDQEAVCFELPLEGDSDSGP